MEEIKTFDFIKTPIGSLVELILNRVANDTKEEIEDATESKIAEVETKCASKLNDAQATIDSLKGKITSQDGIISDLQKQNETLVSEIEKLKSTKGLLQEPEGKYGSEAKELVQGDLPIGDSPIANSSSVVDSYAAAKKARTKSSSSKSKGTPKSTKKSVDKVQIEDAEKDPVEFQTQVKEAVTKPSTAKEDGLLPFESNE